jgi:hypothetical protein
MGLFLDCFGELPDPRRGNARRHDLLELLTIALSATLCGAASCVDFELFARSKEEFLSLVGGVPSHDTFSRLSRLLDPAAFSTCLTRSAMGPWRLTARACAAAPWPRCARPRRSRSSTRSRLPAAWRWGSLACRTGQASQVRPASTRFSKFAL